MRARRDTDADAVGLEFLGARKLAIVSLDFASASAVMSGSLLHSVMTRVATAASRALSSRIDACFASTCAISWLSTEDSSDVSQASAIKPRVT